MEVTMISLSLCMIVKNEEMVLKRCLDSVKNIVDEIIIVDTGSTDKTKDIAKKFTKNIYDFKWIDDFAAARNYSFSKATKEYIMWLDADDVILKKDREKQLWHLSECKILSSASVLMTIFQRYRAKGEYVDKLTENGVDEIMELDETTIFAVEDYLLKNTINNDGT